MLSQCAMPRHNGRGFLCHAATILNLTRRFTPKRPGPGPRRCACQSIWGTVTSSRSPSYKPRYKEAERTKCVVQLLNSSSCRSDSHSAWSLGAHARIVRHEARPQAIRAKGLDRSTAKEIPCRTSPEVRGIAITPLGDAVTWCSYPIFLP